MATPQVIRLATLTALAELALLETFNDHAPAEISAGIEAGELALLEAQFDAGGSAYAIVSRQGDAARIEALAGAGGMWLARQILKAARGAGLKCDAWVKSESLARLTCRIGLYPTGERHGTQLRVAS